MALTPTEEALVRQLLDQQAAILSLAGNEATITSKLGATKVTLSDLLAASAVGDTDLFLIRQGTQDKSATAQVLRNGLQKFTQDGTGAIERPIEEKLRDTVSVKEFGVVGDGIADDTIAIRNAVAASEGKILLGVKGETYLIRDEIVIPSNVTIDWQGATIVDDVRTFRPSNQANRAKPLFYMYGVSGIKISNFAYEAAATRATVSNEVPTGIIWIGGNSTTGAGPTHSIEISNIQASNCADYSLFVAIVGNAYDLAVRNIDIQGDCSYGINIEYGEAATGPNPPDNYGMYPYNITVEHFNGYNNATSVGFLRVAAAYNIKFLNCYGENVKSFIYAWTGDRGIQRVSQSVVFENCTHYAGANFLTGVVNYVVQVLSPDKDGSTDDPLPAWTNQDHLFTFNNCQFQNNKVTDSSAVRFYGSQGSVTFNSCVLQDSYFGARVGPASNPTYTSFYSLRFNNCVFKNNTRDAWLSSVRGVVFDHCAFKEPDNVLIPVKLETSSFYNEFRSCQFKDLVGLQSYIVIDAGCSYNRIKDCTFASGPTVAALDLSAVTFGSGNVSSAELCRSGWDYYGLQGQPESLYQDISITPANELDYQKRTHYVALTGGVNETISSIVNGRIGDVVTFQSASVWATVTFTNLAAVGTLNRLVCPSNTNLTKTGSFWTVTAKLTEVGWIVKD